MLSCPAAIDSGYGRRLMGELRTATDRSKHANAAAPDGASEPSCGRKHILTVVLEDYYQVGAFAGVIPTEHWHRFESRVEDNAKAVLSLLEQAQARATFFVPGWIAERTPAVVRELAERGHGIACQGYLQRRFDEHGAENFRADLRRSRGLVEAGAGRRVRGFRIGQGGLDPGAKWPLDVLAEECFDYDSSLRPLGWSARFPLAHRVVHQRLTPFGEITEVPVSSQVVSGFCVPIAGGNFIRQLPGRFIRAAIQRWLDEIDAPLVGYFHAWELDPGQPRVAGAPRLQRLRHYRNLDSMRERILEFLQRHRFTSIEAYLGLETELITAEPYRTEIGQIDSPRNSGLAKPAEPPAQDGQAPLQAPASRDTPQISGPTDTSAVAQESLPVTIVVPCYNEEANVAYLFNALGGLEREAAQRYTFSYLFVDDGSTDSTVEVIRSHDDGSGSVRLISHVANRGIAAAVQTGLQAANTDVVCCIDCDCTFNPSHLLVMLPMLKPGVDLVVASPFMPGGQTQNVPAWRRALSKGANTMYRFVLHSKLTSYTACFRVYRRDLMVGAKLNSQGFCGITELLAHVDRGGGTIIECPAVLESRLFGESKIRIVKSVIEHLRLIARLGWLRLVCAKDGSDHRR